MMDRLSALAKLLASDQLKVRRIALIEASNFLSQPFEDGDVLPSYTELMALCKGLYYSLWMQDKLLLKEEVVARICEILPRIKNRTVLINYSNAVFETLAREWDRLDNWRVDKFMLLARDFFITGLRLLPEISEEMWDEFLTAIFEKVLNKDIQHAIGLKMHVCTILGEELSKKKIKSFCVVLTLLHLVRRLKELPRHHSYGHTLLRLIYALIRSLRRHANPSLDVLIDCAAKCATRRGGYRKSFRQMANTLSCIRESKLAKRGISKSGDEEAKATFAEGPLVDTPMVTDEQNDVNANTELPKMKRKSLNKSTVRKAKKRRLVSPTPVPNPSTVDSCSNVPVLEEAPTPGSPAPHTGEEIRNKPKLENIVSLSASPAHSLQEASESFYALPLPTICGTDVTTHVSNDCSPSVVETPTSNQRRVSFGKVFRKKFRSTQRLSMTPTVKTTPSKGILRERSVSITTKSRLSL